MIKRIIKGESVSIMNNQYSSPEALFVYGTLLQESNSEMSAYMRENVLDLGKGHFSGRLYDLGEYPGAIAGNIEAGKVFGHVYLLKNAEEVLQVLDAYEEYGPDFPEPNLFIRDVVDVYANGATKRCWVYLYNHAVSEGARITSGDYLNYLQSGKK